MTNGYKEVRETKWICFFLKDGIDYIRTSKGDIPIHRPVMFIIPDKDGKGIYHLSRPSKK